MGKEESAAREAVICVKGVRVMLLFVAARLKKIENNFVSHPL